MGAYGAYSRQMKTSSLTVAKMAKRLPFNTFSVSSHTSSSFDGNRKSALLCN